MDKSVEERVKKAKKIIDLYKSREYRQEDVAQELNIPLQVVREVTKAAGYAHGKMVTLENRNDNQFVKPVTIFGDLCILDKYDF